MSVFTVLRFEVSDPKRFTQMQETFNAARPKGSVVLAWDLSPCIVMGGQE